MANEIKDEEEERFKAHVQKYQAEGFTLKQAKEEAEMCHAPRRSAHYVLEVSGIS